MNTIIHFLGTRSGTEPYPGRHHTSFMVERQGHLYCFDAGEGCHHTAHLMGLNALNIDKIVISHAHIDHVGGLMNLISLVKKLRMRRKQDCLYGNINLYIPDLEVWHHMSKLLEITDYRDKPYDFMVQADLVQDGVVFDDGILKVTAYHNKHLRFHSFEPWKSYSFVIEAGDKKLVFSGDVASCDELEPLLEAGCDALVMETGHHSIDSVYELCKGKKIGKVYFNHHGREILDDEEDATQKIADLFGEQAIVCKDGMSVCL